MTVTRCEGCFRHILRCDADLPVTRAQVQLAEVASALQLVEQLVDARERIAVASRGCVQCSVVNDHALTTVGLGNEKHGRAPGRARGPNEAFTQ